MDSNNMYQNQQSGQNPDSNQNGNPNGNQGGYYQNTYTQGDNNQNTYTNANPNPNPNANPSYQYNPYNNGYQPAYQPMQTDLEEPVTIGEWLVTMLIMMVPCVNIIMMFVWAFGSDTKKSKSNYFKVVLIFAAISLVLSIVLGAAIGNMFQSFLYYYN